MNYPKDITQLVTDLANTPGVQRVFLRRVDHDRMAPTDVWPSKFKANSAIVLREGFTLHIEGEWHTDWEIKEDMVGLLNAEREKLGLTPLSIIASITNGKINRDGIWSGDMAIGFKD